MRRHVQFFVGICRADFHQTLIRVLFFSRLESKPTEQRKFNLIPIDHFFVADPENLTAGCIYLSRGRCQIFMVRDKKLIDWHQFESPRCLACCFRQKLVDNTKVSIFENRLDQSAQKIAGGRAICSWRHVQIFMVATKKLIDRHQLECGCSIRPARAKIFKSGCNRSFF